MTDKKTIIMGVIIAILLLVIFGYIIYSQIYKAKVQEAYNKGASDMLIQVTNQIQTQYQIPEFQYNPETNKTSIRWITVGDFYNKIYNQNQ